MKSSTLRIRIRGHAYSRFFFALRPSTNNAYQAFCPPHHLLHTHLVFHRLSKRHLIRYLALKAELSALPTQQPLEAPPAPGAAIRR